MLKLKEEKLGILISFVGINEIFDNFFYLEEIFLFGLGIFFIFGFLFLKL